MRRFGSMVSTLGKGPCKKHPAAAGDDVLAAVQFVADGRTLHRRPDACMPKGLAAAGLKREDIPVAVAGDCEPGGRGHHAGARPTLAHFMAPTDFAGLVIDGVDDAFAPQPVVGAGPSVRAVGGLGEIETVARMRVDDE